MTAAAHPRLVTLVREAAGLSQLELSEAIGMSQAYVSKVESGLLRCVGQNLARMAAGLNCPAALLVDDTPVQGLEVSCLHHRRRSSTMTAATKRRIEALTHLTRLSVEGLLQGVELVPPTALERLDLDLYDSPAQVARTLRARWRVPGGPIPHLMGLLESAGVVVVVRPLATTGQDAVSIWPQQGCPPVMVVNTGLPMDKQRFTLAHELGHLVMHRLPRDTQEAEADAFAAELLAPAEDIAEQLQGLTTSQLPRLLELKARWGLSVASLIRRAHDLALISDRQYREFMVKLGRLGWRTFEPVTLPVERPTILEQVLTVHREQHGYSPAQLAAAASMNLEPFLHRYLPADTAQPRTSLIVGLLDDATDARQLASPTGAASPGTSWPAFLSTGSATLTAGSGTAAWVLVERNSSSGHDSRDLPVAEQGRTA